jgi:hypothetical protein
VEDDVDLVLRPLGIGVDGVARSCGGGTRLLPGGVSRSMASIPVVFLLLDFFAVFFAVAEAIDLLEILAFVLLMVSSLS